MRKNRDESDSTYRAQSGTFLNVVDKFELYFIIISEASGVTVQNPAGF